jgi:hypothetical protein
MAGQQRRQEIFPESMEHTIDQESLVAQFVDIFVPGTLQRQEAVER